MLISFEELILEKENSLMLNFKKGEIFLKLFFFFLNYNFNFLKDMNLLENK